MYIWIQILYWATMCTLISFATVYLLDCGFSNSRIGVTLACAHAGSALMQPVIAALFQRIGIRTSLGMSCMYLLGSAIALVLLVVPMGKNMVAALLVATIVLQSCMQPALASLPREFELAGIPVNFGAARGIGSAAFSVTSVITGMMLARVRTSLLPAAYLCTMLLLAASLFLFRAPQHVESAVRRSEKVGGHILRDNPRFALFLAGVVCMMIPHVFIEVFMIQLLAPMGGTSEHQGIAIAIAAVVELPTMLMYSRLSRKVGCGRLLLLVGWLWVVKDLMTLFARSPMGIYASEVMQFCTLAVYVPAAVEYVAIALPPRDFLKGQALAGSAATLGNLICTLAGGRMIDLVGVHTALAIMIVFAVAGAVLFTLSVSRRKAIS